MDSKQPSHQLEDHKELLECIRFLDAKRFSSLSKPLPRGQDLPEEYFGKPSAGTEVISVSHAWRNQAHPDPTCQKAQVISQLLSEIGTQLRRSDTSDRVDREATSRNPSVLLFLDFLSISQRPFAAGQEPRTEEESEQFKAALSIMHETYFYSDRIIHLPWEDCRVPQEKSERLVSLEDLRDASFSQAGSCVQLSTPFPSALFAARGLHLFDEIVSVSGAPISSIKQVEAFLSSSAGKEKEGKEKQVLLRHFPFGLVNTIPADDRGWVFLERFITMVKCAMMDEDTAKKVVITTSNHIFQQIMEGANRLREASRSDSQKRGSDELKSVLENFALELQKKKFSAASTDKRELDAKAKTSDRDVVFGIMRQFVDHLAEHWEQEATKQRTIARRLRSVMEATQTFILEWDCFSEGYAAELTAQSTNNPWPFIAVLVYPVLVTLPPLLYPHPSPDEGWRVQTAFFAGAMPVQFFICLACLIGFVAPAASVNFSPNVLLRFAALCILGGAMFGGTAASIAAIFDIFPVPGIHFLASPITMILLPMLWYAIPSEQRASSQFRRRMLVVLMAESGVVGVFGIMFPLLNALMPAVGVAWQAVVVAGYLAAKLAFEVAGVKLSKLLGADVMPYFVFLAAVIYQINLCAAFASVSSWLIVIEQITFDVLENAFHLWSMWRQEPGCWRQEQYIVASLMLREFVEVMVPIIYLTIFNFLGKYNPDQTSLTCNKSPSDCRLTENFLTVDIAVELMVTCITCIFLQKRGHSPLKLLRGLIATRVIPLTLIAGGNFVFFLTLAHSHGGNDLTFQFGWLREEDAHWQCGLTWSSSP